MSQKAVIDGITVPLQGEESILEAARRTGIEIPTLCDDSRLSPVAGCRLCVVKINGYREPVASCAHPLKANAEITTKDPDLDRWRRSILKLVLSENPAEGCTKCDQGLICELHTLTHRLGVERGYDGYATSGTRLEDSNPFILRDYTQCIHCYRCTRICQELEQVSAIAPAGRGYLTRIVAGFDSSLLDSPCTFCGQCIQTCPTGALSNRKLKRAGAKRRKVSTICPYCGTGCGIELHVSEDRLLGVTPVSGSPANEGSLCVKGQFGLDFIHSPDRLTRPLIRGGDGTLHESTWGEAYDLVAHRFTQIKDESGPNALTFWSSSRSTTESNYLMQKFARAVIGTNNIDNCART